MPLTSKLCSRPLGTAVTLAALSVVIGLATSSAALSADTKKYGYVTTALALPATNTEANAYARDIDRDGDRDNGFGQFLASAQAQGLDFQAAVDADIAQGDLLMLHSLRAPSLANTREASWQVLFAEPTEAPDFSGAGSFTVGTPRSARLPAKIKNHHLKTAVGTIPLRLDLLGGIFDLSLKKAKVFATCFKSSCSDGRINGAITAQQVDTGLLPELASRWTPIVQRDCTMAGQPDGGCMADSEGKRLFLLFDANRDLVITAQELRDNSLVQTSLAPDLDLVKANGRPGRDGVNDALSAGLGFEAVRAKLVRP